MRITFALARMLPAMTIFAIAGATVQAIAASVTLDKIRSSGMVTLGYRGSSIPFSYLGGDQKPVGLSMDLCAAVVERLKTELRLPDLGVNYTPVNASNRIPLIQNGTIDIECGSTSYSAERQKQVGFSVTTFVSQPRWLVSKSSGIFDTSGLAGKTVVVTQGSLSLPIAEALDAKDHLGLKVVQAKDQGESFLMLRTGRASAWFEENILIAGLRSNSINPDAYTFLPDASPTQYFDGLMLPKDDPEFKAMVDGVLSDEMASGSFNKLYVKWFTSPIPPNGHNLDLPMSDALKARVEKPSDALTP